MSAENRAYGALLGLAIGDALGMPTQYQPRALIAARYGVLDWFQPGPEDNFISRGMAAGRVTDDTDQAVLLGEMLVAGKGRIDPEAFAQALLAWEARMIAAGSADLLGPSTRHALTLVAAGTSTELTGRSGATNGAAMRVASAVAAAVSAGIAGASLSEALAVSIEAAKLGAERGFYFAGGDVAARTEWALDLVRGRSETEALDLIYRLVGTGVATNEAVPAAIAICAVAPTDPWRVCCLAASLGGDCDTVAAIAGAIMGACHGAERFPPEAVEALRSANPELRLEALARDLLALRAAAGG